MEVKIFSIGNEEGQELIVANSAQEAAIDHFTRVNESFYDDKNFFVEPVSPDKPLQAELKDGTIVDTTFGEHFLDDKDYQEPTLVGTIKRAGA